MKFLFPFLCLFTGVACYSQNTIGDVKFSALRPEVFTKLNPDWIEMDGGNTHLTDSLFTRSLLHTKYGLEKLPDGRGVFIRGMNSGRNSESGDPDPKREVGEYQKDDFKKHNHNMRNWSGSGGQDGNELSMATHLNKIPERSWEGGDETRPRNICLYVYIKIN